MRTGRHVLALTAVLALALGCAASGASEAAAEWKESSWPCGVAPWAILPAPLYWTSQVDEPYTPTEGSLIDTAPYPQAPPASNFTATVAWGDGTTSAADVSEREYGCYLVSAPAHTYGAVGTYSFSYVVHDVETGEERTIGARDLHVWNSVPQLLGGASGVIRARVGVPWSGVLAEFSYEGAAIPSAYSALIDWGDGTPPQPGAITVQSGSVLAVSGTFVYARPLTAAVTVLLSYFGRPVGTWFADAVLAADAPAPGPSATPETFRLLGQSLLAAISSGRRTEYVLVFRVDRRLPQTASGRVTATLAAFGRRDAVGVLSERGSAFCYVAHVRVDRRRLRAGTRYPFSVAVPEGSIAPAAARAVLHRLGRGTLLRTAATRRLGC